MKKSFFGKFVSLFIVAAFMPSMLSSCKDYDCDIDNLQDQINDMNSTLNSVQDAVNTLQNDLSKGTVITGVKETADGITITLSNGKSYTIYNGKDGKDGEDGKDGTNGENGTNGQNGADGKDGVSWEIGPDGYWYRNGVKTDYYALGSSGSGSEGTPGKDGKDGAYYYPNTTTHTFWKVDSENPFPGVETNISYMPPQGSVNGISAVYAGNYLTLSWYENGKPVSVTVDNGVKLASLEFIPSVLNPNVDYPTTDNQIYSVDGKLEVPSNVSATNFINSSWYINPKFNKSNEVQLEYRVSPANAYVAPNPVGSFINRNVKTRAAISGDQTQLMNVIGQEYTSNPGVVTVTATYNQTESNWVKTQGREYDFVAYQLTLNNPDAETTVFTTDYIAPDPLTVAPRIVDGKNTKSLTAIVPFYDNIHPSTILSWQTNAYLQSVVGPAGRAENYLPNLSLYWDGDGIDLEEYVRLLGYESRYPYTNVINWMGQEHPSFTGSNLGFSGISYKFSLPAEYLANDPQHTNQQYFITLDGSVVKAYWAPGTSGTQTIGRTPVVRVDAYMTENTGTTSYLVASSYIKLYITEESQTEPGTPPSKLGDLVIGPNDYAEGTFALKDQLYRNLPANAANNQIGIYPWKNFNNQIYGNPKVALTSSTFWNYYGNDSYEYTLSVEATLLNGQKAEWSSVLHANENYRMLPIANVPNSYNSTSNAGGLYVSVGQWTGETQTTNIEFYADYNARTQLTYKGDGVYEYKDNSGNEFDGALYKVTMTINANSNYENYNIVLWDDFSVTNTFPGYTFNPNYYPYEFTPDNGTLGNYVATKGKVVNNHWALEMNTMEAFQMINNQNVFQYYATTGYNIDPNVDLIMTYRFPASHAGWELNPERGQSPTASPSEYQLIYVDPELGSIANSTVFGVNQFGNRLQALIAPMQYTPTFYNTETWPQFYNVLFLNPFKAGSAAQVGQANLYPNYVPGTQFVDLSKNVYVVDDQGNTIFSNVNGVLTLSNIAGQQYKLQAQDVNVTYAFKQDTYYNQFKGQLTNGSIFGFNLPDPETGIAPGPGVVTYNNNGATTVREFTVAGGNNLTVIISVTFDDVSIVTVEVPFQIFITGSPNK